MTQSVTLKKKLNDDINSCFTPDQPSLRYNGGPIKVFLWDELTIPNKLSSLDNSVLWGEDYVTVSSEAITRDTFVLLRNRSNNIAYYDHYLLKNRKGLTSLIPGPIAELPVEGRLINISLFGLRALDNYYANNYTFVRKKIMIRWNDQTASAFCYTVDPKQLTKFDPHKKEFKFISGIDISLSNKVYKFGRWFKKKGVQGSHVYKYVQGY